MTPFVAVFGGIIGVGLLSMLSSIANGYALSVLWGWFIVPTCGAPALGVFPAIGIAIMVGCLTHQTTFDSKKDDDDIGALIAEVVRLALGKPAFALFFGWIVHLFM